MIAIDVGNTDIVLGSYLGNELVRKERKATVKGVENFSDWLNSFVDNQQIVKIGLSCVVPRYLSRIVEGCTAIAETVIIKAELFPDLVIKADDRNELGADFIGSYFGAISEYRGPITVFDLGSASKIMVINERAEIEGVMIKPGLVMSLDAMLKNIPHLPPIEIAKPQDIIGHNSVQAIRSGIFYGELASIEYTGTLLDRRYDFASTKIITGGYSAYFRDFLPNHCYEPDLLLKGINKIIDNY